MPLYEYECFLCHHRFERIQRVSADPISECPACGGVVRRLLGTPALQFKGSGWYVTDYGNRHSPGTTDTGGAGDSSATTSSNDRAGTASDTSSGNAPKKSEPSPKTES